MEQVHKIIDLNLEKGKTIADVRKKLKRAKYSDEMINKIFESYNRKQMPFLKRNKQLLYILGIMVLISFTILAFTSCATRCDDKTCFFEKANDCGTAEFTQAEDTITIEYKIDNCILTKTITELDESEPEAIHELFQDQQMVCPYVKNNFNFESIDSFLNNIEDCEGSLKQIVLQLRAVGIQQLT